MTDQPTDLQPAPVTNRANRAAAGDEKDGRRARSEKSRELIKNAMIALIKEGVREPTAQLVSERAGVGIRSVFRHFEDMETLIRAMNEETLAKYAPLVLGTLSTGTLEDRLDSLMSVRENIYSDCRELVLSSLGLRWKYTTLKKTYAAVNAGYRRQLMTCLFELKEATKETQQAAELLLSFETWNRLVYHQEMARDAARTMVRNLVLRQIQDDCQSPPYASSQ